MKIWFVNRCYHPDVSATGQILTELATDLARSRPVAVISARPSADSATAPAASVETLDGVGVIRLRTAGLGRRSLWRRAVDDLGFHAAVAVYLLRHVGRDDLVVLKTDPPLLQLINTAAVRMKGGRTVNWLQDIYPEIAIRLGKFPGPRWLANALTAWRDRALRAAAANVAVSEAMAGYLRRRGVTNTEVIPNWADEAAITPIAHEHNPLRAEWGLQGRFVVMYSGNFGRAHRFGEIAGAVRQLADDEDICFVFVGGGAGLGELREALGHDAAARHCQFRPLQPKARLRYSLGAADLHLVTLKQGMEDVLMPSKLYGILASGRAVAFVGPPGAELASLVTGERLGFVVPPGAGEELAAGIRCLKNEPARLEICQRKARSLFESHYTRASSAAAWRALLDRVAGAS